MRARFKFKFRRLLNTCVSRLGGGLWVGLVVGLMMC
jgi:hypothetical protein